MPVNQLARGIYHDAKLFNYIEKDLVLFVENILLAPGYRVGQLRRHGLLELRHASLLRYELLQDGVIRALGCGHLVSDRESEKGRSPYS